MWEAGALSSCTHSVSDVRGGGEWVQLTVWGAVGGLDLCYITIRHAKPLDYRMRVHHRSKMYDNYISNGLARQAS